MRALLLSVTLGAASVGAADLSEAFRVAGVEYRACITSWARAYAATTKEPAADLADGAIAACLQVRERLADDVTAATKMPRDQVLGVFTISERQLRGEAIQTVVETRAKR